MSKKFFRAYFNCQFDVGMITNELMKLLGKVILRILLIDLCKSLRKSNILQLKTKKNKIRNRRPTHANKTSQVPVNLIMT